MTGLLIEGIPPGITDLGTPAVLAVIALLVITDKLVWHTRLKTSEARVQRLEEMLWASIGVAERATAGAEVTSDVLSKLPGPGARESA